MHRSNRFLSSVGVLFISSSFSSHATQNAFAYVLMRHAHHMQLVINERQREGTDCHINAMSQLGGLIQTPRQRIRLFNVDRCLSDRYYGLSEIPVYRCAFHYLSSSIISHHLGPKVFVPYFGPSAQEKYVQAPLYYVCTPLRRDRHEITQMSEARQFVRVALVSCAHIVMLEIQPKRSDE